MIKKIEIPESEAIRDCTFSPDGLNIVVVSHDGKARFWTMNAVSPSEVESAPTFEPTITPKETTSRVVNEIVFHSDRDGENNIYPDTT